MPYQGEERRIEPDLNVIVNEVAHIKEQLGDSTKEIKELVTKCERCSIWKDVENVKIEISKFKGIVFGISIAVSSAVALIQLFLQWMLHDK